MAKDLNQQDNTGDNNTLKNNSNVSSFEEAFTKKDLSTRDPRGFALVEELRTQVKEYAKMDRVRNEVMYQYVYDCKNRLENLFREQDLEYTIKVEECELYPDCLYIELRFKYLGLSNNFVGEFSKIIENAIECEISPSYDGNEVCIDIGYPNVFQLISKPAPKSVK